MKNQDKPFGRTIVIRIVAHSHKETNPTLTEVSNFFYDVNMHYEVVRLATDPQYENFQFSHWAYMRNGRPLRSVDRLRVRRLKEESPLEIVTAVAAASGIIAALWAYVQMYEKLADWKVNRARPRAELRKIELEIEKLELENNEKKLAQKMREYESEATLRQRLEERDADNHYRIVTNRLDKSSLRIDDLELKIEDDPAVTNEAPEKRKR